MVVNLLVCAGTLTSEVLVSLFKDLARGGKYVLNLELATQV
jgi:hypothetical protein